MPIPTAYDRSLGEIETASSSIMTQLRVLQHASARDAPSVRARLREMLQGYADSVVALANEGSQ
jgi:hypothetical protein